MILIGPENNDGGRHCEPEPLYLQQQCSEEWRLVSKFRYLTVLNLFHLILKTVFRLEGEDLICVYDRR